MHGINGMGWGMGFGWIIGLFVLVAIIWLVTQMAKTKSEIPASQRKSALDILNERYASGEIKKEEYDQLKHDIL